MARIENYRKGDRAEKLGVVLLQAFCAVAEIPRQEDFGLADAVATILRRDGRFLYAEDSFLVQMKSRTERQIEYFGSRFEALLSQDLSLLVAQIDAKRSAVELHTLGIGLSHPNINDVKGLVAHLHPKESCASGPVGDVLHVPLRKPILAWTIKDTESRAFTDKAFTVLKAWLNTERWNRRYRRAGVARHIHWETNAVPTVGPECQSFNPAQSRDTLGEIAPMVRLLAFHGVIHPRLRAPTRAIFSWLRERGIEADPDGQHTQLLQFSESIERLARALDSNPGADVAVTFCINDVRPDFLAFRLYARDRGGNGSGEGHIGSLQAIRDQDFKAEVEIVGEKARVTLGLADAWLDKRHLIEATPINFVHPPDLEEGTTPIILLRSAT